MSNDLVVILGKDAEKIRDWSAEDVANASIYKLVKQAGVTKAEAKKLKENANNYINSQEKQEKIKAEAKKQKTKLNTQKEITKKSRLEKIENSPVERALETKQYSVRIQRIRNSN